jgi:site-specific recombinase XerD
MKWNYWRTLFIETHCTARGLKPKTIAAYHSTLGHFRGYVQEQLQNKEPDEVNACDVLQYVDYLRRERDNGAAAVNRQVTVIKCFYRATVAMGHLEPRQNPMAHFPKIKAAPRRFSETLNEDEVARLIESPDTDTVLGIRDRALLILIYGTGIRASECSGLDDDDIDLNSRTVRVLGKGGHERTIPLNEEVVRALAQYRLVRDSAGKRKGFFISRRGKRMGRGAIYQRVRLHAQNAGIRKRVSPHRLRHTFATHLVRAGVDIVTVRDLLGHRLITSTQIYLHMTAEDLRKATDRHPIGGLIAKVADLLPDVKLPFQKTHFRQRA